jgi:acetone carboxylase gamma subunit
MQRFIAKTKRCDRTGKVSYRDEHSANRAIVNITHVSDRELVPVRAYKCPFCAHFHLTSREERA